MTIKPLNDRVLVRPSQQEEMSPGGVYLPQSVVHDEQITTGTVVAVGPGCWEDLNDVRIRVKPDVEEGQKVLFRPFGGTEVKLDGETLRLLKSNEVLAVIEP